MTTVAVIIPYYQKREGILRRALESILAQDLPPGVAVRMIVTDDGSPVPVDGEVADLTVAAPFALTVIKQANAGASAARNACLGAVPEGTDFVAFLDSDDYWAPQHLAHAVATLSLGYDYYFCDNTRLGAHTSYFAQTKFDEYLRQHGTDLGSGRFAVETRGFISFSLRAFTSLTPTIVFRWSIAPDLRFENALRTAGEDCLYFFDVMARSRGICCSTSIDVTCADGVNMFYSTYEWDAPGHLQRRVTQLLKWRCFLAVLSLNDADKRYVEDSIQEAKDNVAFFSVRELLKKGPGALGPLHPLRSVDNRFWLWFPASVAQVLVRRAAGRFKPAD